MKISKWATRSRKSKMDRQYNGQMQKDKQIEQHEQIIIIILVP